MPPSSSSALLWNGGGAGTNHPHPSTTTTARNNNNSTTLIVDPRQRLLQLRHTPAGQSLPLRAVLQLLQDFTEENANVYLLTPDYLLNWLAWALHQQPPASETSEVTPLTEAVRMAALQYHLPAPLPSLGTTDYDDPGPMDATPLSVEGHPLLLNPLAQALDGDWNENGGSGSLRQHYYYHHHHHHFQSDPHIMDDDDDDDDAFLSPSSMRVQSLDRRNSHVNNATTTMMRDSHSERPIVPTMNGNGTRNHKHRADSAATTAAAVPCVAVPEAFYETLRRIHGVRCDDFATVSFQPYHDGGDSSDSVVLHHHRYHHNHHHHPNNHNSNGHNQSTAAPAPPPRPVEFRRKVIRQALEQQPPPHHSGRNRNHWRDYPPLRSSKSKPKNNNNNNANALMEKLLLEEQIAPPTRLAVEVHPVKLLYETATASEGESNEGEHHPSNHNHNHSGSNGGFLLVSRAAPALDAVRSLRRAAAEPLRLSLDQVRVWDRWEYGGAHGSSPTRDRSPTQNNAHGGYELVDVHHWLREEQQSDGGGELLTTGAWVERHRAPAAASSANDDGSVVTAEQPPLENSPHAPAPLELELLLEIRRSARRQPWPRRSLELACRLQVGDWVDAQDVAGRWYEARVTHVGDRTVTVHYAGWARRWDAVLPRFPVQEQHGPQNNSGEGGDDEDAATQDNGAGNHNNSNQNNSNNKSAAAPPPHSRVQPPAPLWSRSSRWRSALQVGDALEVRDSGSLAERPKWYRGVVRRVGHARDRPRPLAGGAALELYGEGDGDGCENGNGEKDSKNSNSKKRPLLVLNQTQQILVEVEQERHGNNADGTTNNNNNSRTPLATDASIDSLDTAPQAQPPAIRWVNLFGEEICRAGTHLKAAHDTAVVTLKYEFDAHRKPVEVMKSHPMHGSGFMRESLRGTPPAPGSVGLHNLGNSCFLNSTVQCLNHIEPLTQYFLQDKYSKDLNKRNPLGSGGNVAIAFASLLKKMWNGNYSVLVPRLLKQTVANFAPQFDNSYQHDSHEFCQFLMDGLHEDLNRVKTKPYVEELEGFGMKDEIAALESWRKHLLRHDSIIVDHCQGMHRSHLTCPQCGRESIKFDVYSSISLPLPQDKNTNTIKLEDCVEKFMEAEQLDERDAYYCPSCRRHVCALKLIALWSVPDILILHLKRFTFDTCMLSGGMLRSKIDQTVEFPINGLDLTKEVLGPIDPEAPPIYNLFGVSEHTGPTANSGHYTATVRNSIDNQWYRCNDGHVGRTSGEASITGGAYLLFYQRAKGSSKWGGMYKTMKERGIDPYDGMNPIVVPDDEGFVPVVKSSGKKSKK